LPLARERSAWAKLAANWLMGEVAKRLNAQGLAIEASPVPVPVLAALIGRVADGTVSNNGARQVFEALWTAPPASGPVEPSAAPAEVDRLIEQMGLRQMSDAGALEALVDQVLAAHPKSVEEFKAGKDKAFNALVGQVMKASQGKANPAQAGEILRRRLAASSGRRGLRAWAPGSGSGSGRGPTQQAPVRARGPSDPSSPEGRPPRAA
jgi:aspartyl-tRNA(Asn)/glutamyl-tRNA(Gln) amidotransferase subunit B